MMRYLTYTALLVVLVTGCAKRAVEAGRASQRQPEPAPSVQQSTNPDKVAEELPLASHTSSPASLVKENADGTLLIKIKPHVYMSEMGCTMVSNEQGDTFSQLYYVIAFSIQAKQYYTVWGVHFGKGPPLKLDREKEYRFHVKPYRKADFKDESVPCAIIKIWEGDDVVFEKQEKERTQPTDAPGKE